MDRKVDLPVPLIPTRPILSVSSMPMVTSVRMGFDTYRFVTCSRFSMFIRCFSGGRRVLSRPLFHSFYKLSSQLQLTSFTARTQISVKISTIRSVTDTGSYENISKCMPQRAGLEVHYVRNDRINDYSRLSCKAYDVLGYGRILYSLVYGKLLPSLGHGPLRQASSHGPRSRHGTRPRYGT